MTSLPIQMMTSRSESAAARRAAARTRATWLLAVDEGRSSVDDVVVAASKGVNPLLSMRLDRLLSAQRGVGAAKAAVVVSRTVELAGVPGLAASRATLGWLLDGRAHGRFDAWLQARFEYRSPWPGFPFTPAPAGVAGVGVSS